MECVVTVAWLAVAMAGAALILVARTRYDVPGTERGLHVAGILAFFTTAPPSLISLLVFHRNTVSSAAWVAAGLALQPIIACSVHGGIALKRVHRKHRAGLRSALIDVFAMTRRENLALRRREFGACLGIAALACVVAVECL
jgi:hypothetical protein